MTMFTLLDRHLGRSIAHGTLLVLGIFGALFVFIVLVDALPDYGQGRFGLYELLRFVFLSQPRKLYEIFPVTVLIGTLLGLSTLALNSELVAMRAAGVSRLRIVGAAVKTGVFLVIAAILVGEYVVPTAETRAQTGRAEALQTGFQRGTTGLWLRDGTAFVNIGEVLPDLSLLRVNIYDVTPDFRLTGHVYAQRASHDGERWQLEDVKASDINTHQIKIRTEKQRAWDPVLSPKVVSVFTIRPEALSIAQLSAYIRHLERNSQDVSRYRLAFWQKVFMPLATGLMMLLAIPFVFRPVRSGGLAQRALIGVVLGLGFVVVHRVFGHLALIYGIPPLFAAMTPLILFLGIALGLMRRFA